jgi:uncharacterized protein (TIGR03435 family)
MARYLVAVLVVLISAVVLTAQSPPVFDVVSIKRLPERSFVPAQWTPGRFAIQAPMVALINMAWGTPMRLEGGPEWLRNSDWDIIATWDATRVVSVEERAPMLRRLLEDRFKIALRRETRESPVYALIMARDGRPGPDLQKADRPCDAPGRLKFSIQPPEGGQRPPCGILISRPANAILGGNTPMQRIAGALGTLVQREVIDRTGLTGEFDIVLRFAFDSAVRPGPVFPDQPPPPADLPNIFTAVQEQLGLKLESTRAPLDFHIVERAELPAEN